MGSKFALTLVDLRRFTVSGVDLRVDRWTTSIRRCAPNPVGPFPRTTGMGEPTVTPQPVTMCVINGTVAVSGVVSCE